MFDKEYSFKGIHAEKVSKLTAKFDETTSLFERNFDVYMMAPVVGFLYGRKADLDKNSSETTKIFPDILMREKDNLMFNYRLIMLLDKNNEPELDKRIDKAFRLYGKEEAKPDKKNKALTIQELTEMMYTAAKNLDFERAMELRDIIFEMKVD